MLGVKHHATPCTELCVCCVHVHTRAHMHLPVRFGMGVHLLILEQSYPMKLLNINENKVSYKQQPPKCACTHTQVGVN